MGYLLIIIHVIVCFLLILIVLLQTGKGVDMGSAFGGGSSQSFFGTTGASTFLSKATTLAAIIFMITSLSLAYLSGDRMVDSILNKKVPVAADTVKQKEDISKQQIPSTDKKVDVNKKVDTKTK